MKTSRRSFLASLVAAVLGRALFRKPAPAAPLTINYWHSAAFRYADADLFNPPADLAAQYKAAREDIAIRVIRSWDAGRGQWSTRMDALWGIQPGEASPPVEFDPHFGVDFEVAA